MAARAARTLGRQVDEQDVAGSAFNECADLGSVALADDQVAFPGARYGVIGHLVQRMLTISHEQPPRPGALPELRTFAQRGCKDLTFPESVKRSAVQQCRTEISR